MATNEGNEANGSNSNVAIEPDTDVATSSQPKNATAPNPTSKKRKQMEPRSVVWQHFEKILDETGEVHRAKCIYCARIFSARVKVNGTSNLLKHMYDCGNNTHLADLKQALLKLEPIPENGVVENSSGVRRLGTWRFCEKTVKEALPYMIVVDELPFRFVEGLGFKQFMSAACPQFKIPSRWTISKDCHKLYLEERSKLKVLLKNHSQRVSLTTDTWTSIQRINYICVTAHWIDDEWNWNKRILSFIPISAHRGEYIASTLENVVLEWGLKKVFSVTVDNASSNDIAFSEFRRKTITWKTTINGGSYMHMRCIAHVLNLVVNDGLKELVDCIRKIRECVRWIRSSPSRLQKFQELTYLVGVECSKSLCLDVPTRWNSTFIMLDVACMYERVFDKLSQEDSSFKCDMVNMGINVPNEHDWVKIKKFSQCLSHFYNLTLKISGSLYVTVNLHYPEISKLNVLLTKMAASFDSEVKKMGENMRLKFDKYWGDPTKMNKLIYFAAILDPKCKGKYVKFILDTIYGQDKAAALLDLVMRDLNLLYNEYVRLYNSASASSRSASSLGSPCELTLSQSHNAPSFLSHSLSETLRPISATSSRYGCL